MRTLIILSAAFRTLPATGGTLNDAQRHVLLVAPQPFYQDRGTPIAVRHLITALAEEGWHVDLLTYPVGEDVALPNARIFRFARWAPFRQVPIGWSAKKLILDSALLGAIWHRTGRRRYACIHALEESIYPALLVARARRLPVIYDMHSSLAEQVQFTWGRFLMPKAFAAWCERTACNEAAAVVCSAGLARKIAENGCTARAHEWQFPDDSMPLQAGTRDAVAHELALESAAKVVMYAGNFEPYQGIDLLLAALPVVVKVCPDAAFVLVGAGEAAQRAISLRERQWIERGNLRVLARRSRAEALALLRSADIAVSPKKSGTNLPLKLFDYLAAGLPVVASRIDAHMPLQGKGLLYTEATPEGLAQGIVRLLTEPAVAEHYRSQARAAAAELTWLNYRRQVAKLYDDALQGRTTPAA